MRSPLPVFSVLSLVLALPIPVAAQGFGVRVTPTGMDELTTFALSQVPSEVVVPTDTRMLFNCPGDGDVTAQFPDTAIELGWRALDVRTEDGRIFVSTTIDIFVATPVDFQNPYACLGSATCDLSADLDRLTVEMELAAATSPDGGIEFHGATVDLQLLAEDLAVESEGCAVGEIATWLFNAFEGWALERLVPRVEVMLGERISETLTGVFAETLGLSIEAGGMTIDGWLDTLDLSAADGMTAGGGARMAWNGTPVYDVALPEVHNPEGPAIPSGMAGQLQVAAADRLVTEALYEAHRGGLINQMLRDQALSIDLGGAGVAQQLGLSSDTTLDIAFEIEQPLAATFGRVAPNVAELSLRGLHVWVDLNEPGAEPSRIDVRVDGTLGAEIGVDQDLGSLVLAVRGLDIERVLIEGEDTTLDIDGARLRGFIERTVMPMLAERLSGLPIAPALHPIAGSFLAIRTLESDGGWQRVGVDLFTPDASDMQAPDTSLAETPTLLPAGTQSFRAVGRDDRTPNSLLRYRAWLDDEPLRGGMATSMRDILFDAADGEHVLEVSAVDANDNMDRVPVIHAFVVDGLPPELTVTESPDGIVLDSAVRAAWDVTDERSSVIESRWILRILDADGAMRVIQEAPFAPDRFETAIDTDSLEVGELYDLEIVARDEAGNVTSQTFGFALHPDLASGCSAAGDASPLPTFAFLFILAGFLSCRRRR